jgi:hypothetical protein
LPGFPISIKKFSGSPIPAGNVELTLISQAVIIRSPGQAGGLVWNRPVAVRVETPGKDTQVLPVYDYTRLGQILFLGAGLLGSALIWLIFRKRSNSLQPILKIRKSLFNM